jgi:Rax2 C-terminal beta propeller domain/FlgD Ig-like domain/Domain of unknown function (DUF5122) beta-propeller
MLRASTLLGVALLLLGGLNTDSQAKWQRMGSLSAAVFDMAIFRGELVAAGSFIFADGQDVHHIARWDGSRWQPLGTGLGYSDENLDERNAWATSLLVHQDDLYVGGEFTRAGDASVHYVARWDGSQWYDVGGGVGGQVYALCDFQNQIIVGGRFESTQQREQIYYVTRFRNGSWRPVGEGLSSIVFSLEVFDRQLIAGGRFSFTGARRPINRVATWDGSIWTSVGETFSADGTRQQPLPPTVLDLAVLGDKLYATGVIDRIGDESFAGLAQWTGQRWVQIPVADGKRPLQLDRGFTLGSYGGELVVGGLVVAGAPPAARHLTRYRAGTWEPFDNGVNDFVQAMIEFDGSLVVGGNFTQAGGKAANYIARWTETGTPVWAPTVRVVDLGTAVEFEMELSLTDSGTLELRREGPRGSALVDRRQVHGLTSVVLRDPSPLEVDSRYWIRLRDDDGNDRSVGPFALAQASREWQNSLRQLPSTGSHLRFELSSAQSGRISLDVVDLRGRRLRTLFTGEVPAGLMRLEWDGLDEHGTRVARGRYILSAKSADRRSTLLMTYAP